MESETNLILLLKDGNEKAFEQIFNKYFEGLCVFAESITRNHEVAEDIVEDIFLRIWTNCKINPVEISLKSYLYQSTYNNAIKYVSRIHKNNISIDNTDQSYSDPYVLEILTPEFPVANLIAKELEEKATRVIQSLPEQCRKIYLLNRDEDMNYHEIAKRLQISDSTVKTQMGRAYSKLRDFLKDYLYILL